MNFNDLKIKNKFISVLTIIAVLVIIMMGLSYFSFMKMSNMMEEFSNVQYVNTKAQMDMRKDIQTINKRILLAIYEPGENPVADQRADFVDRFDGMKKNIDTIGRTLGNPELINQGPETAPSKRIIKVFADYENNKPAIGSMVAHEVGVDVLRGACRHFNEWLTKLERLG